MLIRLDPDGPNVTDPLSDALIAGSRREVQPSIIAALLRDSTLFVLQHPGSGLSDADVALGRISLGVPQIGGRNFVAVFSSILAIESVAQAGAAYAGLSGTLLLRMWSADDWLILNPGGRCQLVVSPAEVATIARGGEASLRVETNQ
jgi:SseB protein N-terminal domain